jgi:hypothetical protein
MNGFEQSSILWGRTRSMKCLSVLMREQENAPATARAARKMSTAATITMAATSVNYNQDGNHE